METLNEQFSTSCASYRIRVATPNDLPSVLEVLRDNFHFEETIFNALCSNVKITQDEREMIETILDDTAKVAFNGSPCLVAIHNESNRIVGLNQTTLTKNNESKGPSNEDLNFSAYHNTKSVLVNKYFKYLSELNEKALNCFASPNEAMLEFYAIAVDKTHRRNGISSDLMKAGIIVAQHIRDIPLVFGVFTSYYSMKSAKKVGLHTILELDLLNYLNDENELIFANTMPHNIVYIMVLHIENNYSTKNVISRNMAVK